MESVCASLVPGGNGTDIRSPHHYKQAAVWKTRPTGVASPAVPGLPAAKQPTLCPPPCVRRGERVVSSQQKGARIIDTPAIFAATITIIAITITSGMAIILLLTITISTRSSIHLPMIFWPSPIA